MQTISKYAKELQNAQPVELVLQALLDAILREEDMPALKVEYTELADTLDILHPTPLPADLIVKLTKTAHFYLSTFAELRKKRMDLSAGDTDDDTMAWEQGKEEIEDEVLDVLRRIIHRVNPESPLLFTIGGLKQMNANH